MRIPKTLTAVVLTAVGFAFPALAESGTVAAKAAPHVSADNQPQVSIDTPPEGDDTRLETLPNGLTILVKVDKRFPMVSTRLLVHAGSAYEKPEEAGISHMLEHMVFKGTTSRPKGEVSRQIEAAGGYLNAFTSLDWTCYINDLPSQHWKLGMDVARDMAFNPLLDAAELESEKNVVVEEMKLYQDKPGSELYKLANASVFHGTAYEAPVIGYEKTVRAITVDSMKAYRKRLYQPRNMLLAVVGNVNLDEVLAEARKQYGNYENTSALQLVRPMDAASLTPQTRLQVRSGPWNKVFLAVTMPIPGSPDVRSSGLDVLAYLLGGDETSLLHKKYKDELKLVDGISASAVTSDRAGMLYITATLDADKVESLWKALSAELAGLKNVMFTPGQIDRAILNIEDGYFRSRETLSELALQLAYNQFFLGGQQGEINSLAALRAVDMPQVRELIEQWVVPNRMSLVVLAPDAAVKAGMADSLRAATPSIMTAEKAQKTTVATAAATETVDLGNGRTVVLIPDKTMPYFALNLVYSGGETLIKPDRQGLGALAANVLTRGTETMDKVTLTAYLADRAAGLGASAGRQTFGVSVSGQSRFSKDLLGLLGDVLQHPAFNKDDLATEKADQVVAIRHTEDSPLGLLSRRMGPFLFPGSVFGYEALGNPKGVEALTREDVESFWNDQKTRPWVLAVSGDFDREAVLAFAASLPQPTAPAVTPAPPTWNTEHNLTLSMAERKQAHLMMVFKTVPVASEDTAALTLLQQALSGMGGPLFSKLRDEMGLAYTVNMSLRQDRQFGYAGFYIGTDPTKLEQAEAGFTEMLAAFRSTPLSTADLQRGYNQFEGDYWRALQSLGSRAGEAAGLVSSGRPLDYYRELMTKMQRLTPADLQNVAKKYLDPTSAYVITVVPE